MRLHQPFSISSRLMPSLRIGGATLSVGYGTITADGRLQYEVWIDLPDGSEHEVTDLRSGVGRRSIQEGFEALLSFLSAAAEARQYRERTGGAGSENEDLFVAPIVDWAAEHSDDLSMIALELEETPGLIEE